MGKAIRHAPLQQAATSLGHAARQFTRVAIGDGLTSYPAHLEPVPSIGETFGGATLAAFHASWQGRGVLDFTWPNAAQLLALGACGALLLAGAAASRLDGTALQVAAFTLVFLVANAVVTGAVSAVHD